MQKIRILVIGRHKQIMQTVLKLINQNSQWQADGAIMDEEAINLFTNRSYDLVLLGGGIDDNSEQKLRSLFHSISPNTIVIQHFGGGSGLLSNEIQEALDSRNHIR